MAKLTAKIRTGGVGVLWHGSLGAMSATFVGHYPWFFTYNLLQEKLPEVDKKKDGLAKYLLRNAFIGFCCSAVSDTCSNSVRVVKTTTQTCAPHKPLSHARTPNARTQLRYRPPTEMARRRIRSRRAVRRRPSRIGKLSA